MSADGDPGLRGVLEHLDRLAEKDLDQALDLADRTQTPVPVIEATRRSFTHVTRLVRPE